MLSNLSLSPVSDTPPEADKDTQPAEAPAEDTSDSKFEPGEEHHKKLMEWITSKNIAVDLDDDLLASIGSKVKHEYDLDIQSRLDWMEKSKKAFDLAMQVSETKQYPWPKASNVIYPLMTVAAIQFAARAYPAIVSGRSVVKGVVIGDDQGVPAINPQTGQPMPNPQTGQPVWQVPPGDKAMRATRIGEHMSYQLLHEQSEWEEETDKLLHILPIAGCVFRKTFFDPSKGRNMSIMVMGTKVVINYFAKSLETAPRITEEVLLYPLEITENERAEIFIEQDYGPAPGGTGDEDAPHEFLEQHRYLDLDEDGYPEPYVVTVHKDTSKVVRIVARYDHDGVHIDNDSQEISKIEAIQFYTKYDFLPSLDGGIYGTGFGQLLRPINEATNTTLNMLIDAGHLANTGGGFIGKGLSMHVGNVRFVPGEYKSVNATGGAIKENIVPLTFPGPSTVLFQLLGTLIEAGKEISAVKDVLTGEQKNANVPATTTLALIEQGLKTFTAIYKRIHRALQKELDKLVRLNSVHLPMQGAGYRVNNEWKNISKADYLKGNGVEPVSDPSMVSDMQKLGRAQFLMGFANDPMFNGLEIRRRVLDAASIPKLEELLVTNPPPHPDVLINAQKMKTSQERTRAEAAKDYAQTILFLAQASKIADEQHLMWYEHQLEVFKARLEGMTSEGPGESGGGVDQSQLPELETPSSQQALPPISPGLSQGPGGGMPGLPPGGQGGGPGGP